MKIREMINNVESINDSKFILGLDKTEAKIYINYNDGISKEIRNIGDYRDFLKENEIPLEAKMIMAEKNFTKIRDYYQLSDTYYIGEYDYHFEVRLRIVEE